MWLISTSRAELRLFDDPSTISGGYAILSHTWSQTPGEETSFQDLQKIVSDCQQTGKNPRDFVSDKVRKCCIQAERDGYRWVWIDTCCIDKTSSTELSEALNSMFSWYTLSDICYAHLEDVPADDRIKDAGSAFRKARWHTRGWTLQELLAPVIVVFMSKDWQPLGTKKELSGLLNEITEIYPDYLTRVRTVLQAPVSERMGWAAYRKTKRIEDQAYCLLGLFDINMPTIYGEGQRAFQRLQQEIIRQSYDTSLFTWGPDHHDSSDDSIPLSPLENIWSTFHNIEDYGRFLFARSPFDFRGPDIYNTPRLDAKATMQPYLPRQWTGPVTDENREKRTVGPFGRLQLPSFELSRYGMRCRFPVAEVDGVTIAVLLSQTDKDHLGLLLHPAEDDELQDPTDKVYYTGWALKTGPHSQRYCRVARLGNDLYNLRFRGKTFKAEWRDIVIHAGLRPEDRVEAAQVLSRFPSDRLPDTPFHIPRWLIATIYKLDLVPDCTVAERKDDGQLQLMLQFSDAIKAESVRICLGICTDSDADPLDVGRSFHWARAEPAHGGDGAGNGEWSTRPHDCRTDHIDAWPGWEKAFGNTERQIRLSFAHCKHSPRTTRVLHIELEGSVYEELQRSANLFIPKRAELEQALPEKDNVAPDAPDQPKPKTLANSLRTRLESLKRNTVTHGARIKSKDGIGDDVHERRRLEELYQAFLRLLTGSPSLSQGRWLRNDPDP